MNVPRNTRVSVAIFTISSVGTAATGPFLGIYLEVVRNVPLSVIGIVFLTSGILGIPIQIVGGRLMDSLGAKPVMMLGYALVTGLCLVMATLISLGVSVIVIILAYISFSLSGGLFGPATSAITANDGDTNVRTGFALLNVGGNLGGAVGPALGGFLAGTYGYSSIYIFCAGVWAVSAVASMGWIRGGRFVEPGSSEPARPKPGRFLKWRRDRNMILLLSLMFCGTFCVYYETTPLSLYSAGFLHLSDAQIGSLFSLNGVIIVVLQLPLTRLFTRMRRLVMPLTFSVLFSALAMVAAGVSSTYSQMIVVMTLFTFGEIFWSAPSQTIVALFSSPETRGMYQGYYSAFARGGAFAAFIGPASFQTVRPIGLAWEAVAAFSLLTALGFATISTPIQKDYERLHGGRA